MTNEDRKPGRLKSQHFGPDLLEVVSEKVNAFLSDKDEKDVRDLMFFTEPSGRMATAVVIWVDRTQRPV